MPELPDVEAYLEALRRNVVGHVLERVRIASPIVLRTFDPPISAAEGYRVTGVHRLGKRIVLELRPSQGAPPPSTPASGGLALVVHLMIAGRFHWREKAARIPARVGHAALDLDHATLLLTEANATKRASLHLVHDTELGRFARGGIEPLDADLATFREALGRESHTLKRALTDPTIFSGIGNAYSDEILHRAKLPPTRLTRALTGDEVELLWIATRDVLFEWTERLVAEARQRFPEKVTAFRPEMAVHGKYRQPCPVCGSPVQRIRYAENEANYCATCQTGGKLLADRALSRLLREDWPKTLEELEEKRR